MVVYSYKIFTDETNVCVVVDVLNRFFCFFCQTMTNCTTTTMALAPDIRIRTNFTVDHSSDLEIDLFVRKNKTMKRARLFCLHDFTIWVRHDLLR